MKCAKTGLNGFHAWFVLLPVSGEGGRVGDSEDCAGLGVRVLGFGC